MLFLVPLLAGFLRPVRISVDRANEAIDSAESRVDTVKDVARGARALANLGRRVREEVLGSDSAPPSNAQAETEADAPVLDPGNAGWNIGTPLLPRPWAMAFAAALLILFADTLAQIWCPDIVSQASCEEYVQRECKKFANQPSHNHLSDARRAAVDQASGQELIEREKAILAQIESANNHSVTVLNQDLQMVRTNLIEIASRMRYSEHASRFRWAAWICFGVYSVAACIVLKILQEQTVNVLLSAGW